MEAALGKHILQNLCTCHTPQWPPGALQQGQQHLQHQLHHHRLPVLLLPGSRPGCSQLQLAPLPTPPPLQLRPAAEVQVGSLCSCGGCPGLLPLHPRLPPRGLHTWGSPQGLPRPLLQLPRRWPRWAAGHLRQWRPAHGPGHPWAGAAATTRRGRQQRPHCVGWRFAPQGHLAAVVGSQGRHPAQRVKQGAQPLSGSSIILPMYTVKVSQLLPDGGLSMVYTAGGASHSS